jgi:hypothetical protein
MLRLLVSCCMYVFAGCAVLGLAPAALLAARTGRRGAVAFAIAVAVAVAGLLILAGVLVRGGGR